MHKLHSLLRGVGDSSSSVVVFLQTALCGVGIWAEAWVCVSVGGDSLFEEWEEEEEEEEEQDYRKALGFARGSFWFL